MVNTSIYVLVDDLVRDLDDDSEIASATCFIAAFATREEAIAAGEWYLRNKEAIGRPTTVQVKGSLLWNDASGFRLDCEKGWR
jgi:hypothetical protein